MPVNPSAASVQYLRSRMTRVCVAITGGDVTDMLAKADAVVRENPFVEFRLDYLDKPLASIPSLREFLYERSEVTAVATCRRTAGGGKFKGTAAAELEILIHASTAGFHLVDLEIETAESISQTQFAAFRSELAEKGTGLILSSHDFEATRDLDKTFTRLIRFQPDFLKIVSTARNLADNVAMMHFLERKSEGANLIGICMGEQGLVSRVLGVRAGSIFTFAAASQGEETGPGQIAARTLLETYRIDQVENSTRVYGVVGAPVRHSLSPLMQNAAFRRESVNAVFLALETKKLSDLLELVRELPVHGLSITMPFKQEILPFLEKTDALSEKIGACNTVVRAQDGRLFGFNTDVGGITRPIERRMTIRGSKVLVLGAGGAARAAVFGLVEKGAEVCILNRTPETAQKLARQAKAKTIRREQVAKTQFDIILNATPAGMTGHKLASILEPHELNARIVFDTVYNPLETPMIRMAREKGIPVITGVEMFVQQGARQFEIWTGKPAPEEEMMRVVLHTLRRRAEMAGSTPEKTLTLVKPAPVVVQPEKEKPGPVAVAAKPVPVTPKSGVRAVAPAVKAPVPAAKPGKPATAKTAAKAPAKSPVKTAKRKTAAAPPIVAAAKSKTVSKNGHGNGKAVSKAAKPAAGKSTRPGKLPLPASARKSAPAKSLQRGKR
jgi:3-dehydroquinate dehydratase/shikimate dehydrogenase